jgi:hypothetical protein
MADQAEIAVPRSFRPFLAAGAGSIVAGGAVAAATSPTGWDHGSWVAAFLVLVTGISQIGLGAGQTILVDDPPTRRRVDLQAGLLNSGGLLVITGTLVSSSTVVSVGSLMFVASLVWFHRVSVRGRRAGAPSIGRLYHVLLLVLIASTPVGLALSWLRA